MNKEAKSNVPTSVQFALILCGGGLCGVATFGKFDYLAGAFTVEVLGLAVMLIAFLQKPTS